MGQTLTHGVYLPDEGERNCYSGLAANWQLLDGAVGTIAEHTTQIAGKAPAVHTHTKADITDFPAYGTTAGTICEGNDSRLSDARTPVAHTHTKSDVTDLLNSNFVPSANNSYDLGSSSYQWNKIYGKEYYYNGTAWGLDKANEWTNANYFTSGNYNNSVMLVNSTLDLSQGNPALNETNQCMILLSDSSKQKQYSRFQSWTATNQTVTVLASVFRPDANTETDFSVWLANRPNETTFHPYGVPNPNLGNSNFKWKTLNGINPGALSLPGTGGYTNIKGDITNLSGGDNSFTAPYDGWVRVKSTNATVIHIINSTWAVSQSATQSTAGTLCCLCPVMSGQSFSVIVNATSLEYAYIHPCKGNV